MNRLFLTIVALSILVFSKAQEGSIIYRDFEPDKTIAATEYFDSLDTIMLDIDQDGTEDFKMYVKTTQHPHMRNVYITSSWDFRYCYNNSYDPYPPIEDDTIVPFDRWASPNTVWQLLWWQDYLEYIMGFRKMVNNDYYYAWARIYMYINPDGYGYDPSHQSQYDIVYTYLDNVAYCTVPNYPLRWGQKSLDGSFLDEEDPLFVSISPNPTIGQVSISGVNLRLAEVYNTHGRCILKTQGDGDRYILDLSAQPAGLYFISVTDQEGRKCVRKVVKE